MNAVDTGWVTDEDPAELAKMKQEQQDLSTATGYCRRSG
jgi:hypothetical protein